MFDIEGVGVFLGMDVGKTAHHGHGLTPAGMKVFDKPMRGIKGGKVAIKIPASLTTDEVESVALAALQDPALRVVVALSGIHALPARQIRSMLVEHWTCRDGDSTPRA